VPNFSIQDGFPQDLVAVSLFQIQREEVVEGIFAFLSFVTASISEFTGEGINIDRQPYVDTYMYNVFFKTAIIAFDLVKGRSGASPEAPPSALASTVIFWS
jgi:hypothetical protein